MSIQAIEGTRHYSSILETIGNTPLVRLRRLARTAPFSVYAKLEAFNPGGSIKDRAALSMLRGAMESGRISKGSVLIESSSGNLGIGLAQLCRYYGLRFICVVDPRTTEQNIAIIRAWGAEIEMVRHPDPVTGDFLGARIARVKQLLARTPRSFWSNQYGNLDNAKAHQQTMREIVTALGGRAPDYLLCAVSSCGTLRGCAEYVQAHGLKTRIIAVDAVGSVLFGGVPGTRLIPGHGAAQVPALFSDELAHDVARVSDRDCVVGCRALLREEAILAGGSSGGAVVALRNIAPSIRPGARCVLILCDRGERYLETVYSDAWVDRHFDKSARSEDALRWNTPPEMTPEPVMQASAANALVAEG
jgi:2,3-diaminopropionate biosynthesis protein SbnA